MKWLPEIILFFLLGWSALAGLPGTGNGTRRILYVSSYNSSYRWANDLIGGFRKYFDEKGLPVVLEIMELNVRMTPGLAPLREDVETLKQQLHARPYDLVAAADNAAADLFLDGRIPLPENLPLVFCGYSARQQDDSRWRGKNIAGLLEADGIFQTLRLGLRLFPNTSRIAIITDGGDSGYYIRQKLKREIRNFACPELIELSGLRYSTDELMVQLEKLGSNSFVIFSSWSTARAELRRPDRVFFEQLRNVYPGPVLGNVVSYANSGILGGYCTAGEVHGRELAALAERIFLGIPTSRLGVTFGTLSAIFDYPELERFGISPEQIGEDAKILRLPTTFLERHRQPFLVLIGGVITALFFGVLILSMNYRRSRRLKAIFDYLPLRLGVSDRSGRILFLHVSRDRYRDYSNNCRTVEDLPEEIREIFRNPLRRTMEFGTPQTLEFESEKRRFRVNIFKLPNHVFGCESVLWFAVDIQDLYLIRQRAEAVAERFQTTLKSIGDGVIVTDEKRRITLVNAVTEMLTGYPESKLLGRLFLDRYIREEVNSSHTGVSPVEYAISERKPTDGNSDAVLISADGIRRRVAEKASPIFDKTGKLSGAVMVFRDISTDVQRENELVESRRKLERALVEAQKANTAKSYFLATMSHEIRTPLNAVIGFSELLQSGDIAPEQRAQYLKAVNQAGCSLLSLINDVLDLSKLEADQMTLQPEELDLKKFGEEIMPIFAGDAMRKKLRLEFSCPENPPLVYLDRIRLRQVLFNLLGNAVKFTDQGEVRLEVEFEPAGTDLINLVLKISDTGIGIPPEMREAVFQPFVQVQNRVRGNRSVSGTGLGLPIVRKLVLRMNGTIELSGEPGKGSCFTVRLPQLACRRSQEKTTEEMKLSLPENMLSSVQPWKILLVDDVSVNLMVLAAMMRKLNMTIETASSGREALLLWKAFQPDAIFTDLWMPGMNGAELAGTIRSDSENGRLVRLVAVTADSETGTTFDMTDFDGILLKPVTMEKIVSLIGRLQSAPESPGASDTGESKRKNESRR